MIRLLTLTLVVCSSACTAPPPQQPGRHVDGPPMLRTRERWPCGIPVWAETVAPHRYAGDRRRVVRVRGSDGRLAPEEIRLPPERTRVRVDPHVWWASGFTLDLPEGQTAHAITIEVREAEPIAAEIGGFILSDRISLECAVGGELDDFVTGVRSQAVESWFREQCDATLEGQFLTLGNLPEIAAPLGEAGIDTLALRIDLLDQGVVVASTEAWWWLGVWTADWWWPYANNGLGPNAIRLDAEALPDAIDSLDGLILRLRSEPALALRNIRGDTYWSGEVEIPVRVIRSE